MQFKLNKKRLMDFAGNNQLAMLMMHQATSDYVGCRCCLLNGVFSGFELGAQAVEKYLKAMLLFAHPSSNVRNFSHKLPSLVKNVQEKGIADLSKHSVTIQKLEGHYQARYPDNPRSITSSSTEELAMIDVLIMEILEKMPIPYEVLLNSGVYARAITSSDRTVVFPDEHWLLLHNIILQTRVPFLVQHKKEWQMHNEVKPHE
jgi:hypothetical protein